MNTAELAPASSRRHRLPVPPTVERPVGPDAAALQPADGDLPERARGRRRLAVPVVPPAFDGVVGPQAAAVVAASGELGGGSRRGRGLAVVVQTPAECRAVLVARG